MKRNEVKDKVFQTLVLYDSMPVKTRPLCALCRISSRELQNAVHDLRMDGVKVCSGDDGYWIWDGQDDSWNHTKNQIKSRIKKLSQMYAAMEGTPLEGQQTWI